MSNIIFPLGKISQKHYWTFRTSFNVVQNSGLLKVVLKTQPVEEKEGCIFVNKTNQNNN